MAILSNINGKFAVDSTGAVQFSGAAGTSGYVLKSNGTGSAPTWVDPDTIIGPYLPLSGGTLTGATATANGISFTVGGVLTGTSATFTSTISAVGASTFTLNDGIFIKAVNGTNNVAATNVWGYGLYEGTSKIGEISLVRDGTSSQMYIGTTDANQILRIGSANKVTALTIDASQNATFAGNATIETGINLESGVLIIKNATSDSNGLRIFQDTSDASKIYNNYNGTLQLGVGNTTALTIDSSEGIQLNSYGSGSFTGTTAYNLAVDSSGNIIETTDGGGTVTGTGSAGRVAFWTSATNISSDSTFEWDSTNNRLSINGPIVTYPANRGYSIGVNGTTQTRALRITSQNPQTGAFEFQDDGQHAASNGEGAWLGSIEGNNPNSATTPWPGVQAVASFSGSGSPGSGYINSVWKFSGSNNGSTGHRSKVTIDYGLGIGYLNKNVGDIASDAALQIIDGQHSGSATATQIFYVGKGTTPRVGIGTASPSEELEVKPGNIYINGEDSGLIVDAQGSKRVGFMKYAGHEAVISRISGQDFGIGRTSGSDITDGSGFGYDFYIDGTGKVGIAKTNPGFALDVNGGIASTGTTVSYATSPLSWQANGNTGTYTQTVIYSNQSNTSGVINNAAVFIERGRLTNSASGEIRHLIIGSRGGQSQFTFASERLGINNDSPSAQLHLTANASNSVPFKLQGHNSTSVEQMLIYTGQSAGTGWYNIVAQAGGINQLIIYGNGNIQNANNSYGQISDERLKENIVDTTPKLEDIKKIKVKNFNFIGDDLKQIGMIAQEVEEVFPGLVEEIKQPDVEDVEGGTYKSIKYSVLVPILIKAIQELEARVKELENK